MRKLYISGPMTGLPNYNELEFYRAQELLADFGFMPINPHLGLSPYWDYEDYFRRSLMLLLMADGVALLDGWENSKGAQTEVAVAGSLRLPTKGLAEWKSAP